MPPLIIDLNVTDNYIAPLYHHTGWVQHMHTVPRYGHTNDIMLLFFGTDYERIDYVMGVLSRAIILVLVFLIWTAILILTDCVTRVLNCPCVSKYLSPPRDDPAAAQQQRQQQITSSSVVVLDDNSQTIPETTKCGSSSKANNNELCVVAEKNQLISIVPTTTTAAAAGEFDIRNNVDDDVVEESNNLRFLRSVMRFVIATRDFAAVRLRRVVFGLSEEQQPPLESLELACSRFARTSLDGCRQEVDGAIGRDLVLMIDSEKQNEKTSPVVVSIVGVEDMNSSNEKGIIGSNNNNAVVESQLITSKEKDDDTTTGDKKDSFHNESLLQSMKTTTTTTTSAALILSDGDGKETTLNEINNSVTRENQKCCTTTTIIDIESSHDITKEEETISISHENYHIYNASTTEENLPQEKTSRIATPMITKDECHEVLPLAQDNKKPEPAASTSSTTTHQTEITTIICQNIISNTNAAAAAVSTIDDDKRHHTHNTDNFEETLSGVVEIKSLPTTTIGIIDEKKENISQQQQQPVELSPTVVVDDDIRDVIIYENHHHKEYDGDDDNDDNNNIDMDKIPKTKPTNSNNDCITKESSTEQQQQQQQYYMTKIKHYRWAMTILRVLYFTCLFMIITANLVMIFYGVKEFDSALNSAQYSVYQIELITKEGIDVTEIFLNSSDVMTNAVNELNELCPITTTNDTITQLLHNITYYWTIIVDGIGYVNHDLHFAQNAFQHIQNKITDIKIIFWPLMGVSIFCMVLILGLAINCAISWRRDRLRLYEWQGLSRCVILPLLGLLIFVSVVLCVACVLVAVATSDFCFGEVDDKVVAIVQSFQEQFQSFLYYGLLYYVEGCEWELIPNKENYYYIISQIQDAIIIVHDILTTLSENPEDLEFCEGATTQKIKFLISFIHGLFHVAIHTLTNGLRIFRCSNFNPIYTSLMHDAVCYHGVSGISSIFILLIISVACGMIMFTLQQVINKVAKRVPQKQR